MDTPAKLQKSLEEWRKELIPEQFRAGSLASPAQPPNGFVQAGNAARVDPAGKVTTTPANPTLRTPALTVSGAAADIALGGSLLFVGDSEGVKVFDVADDSFRMVQSVAGQLQGSNVFRCP